MALTGVNIMNCQVFASIWWPAAGGWLENTEYDGGEKKGARKRLSEHSPLNPAVPWSSKPHAVQIRRMENEWIRWQKNTWAGLQASPSLSSCACVFLQDEEGRAAVASSSHVTALCSLSCEPDSTLLQAQWHMRARSHVRTCRIPLSATHTCACTHGRAHTEVTGNWDSSGPRQESQKRCAKS